MAIVSRLVRADAETIGPSPAILRAKRRSRLADGNSAADIDSDGEMEWRHPVGARIAVWHPQELQRGIAEIELDVQLAM